MKTLYVGLSRAKAPWKIGSLAIRWFENPRTWNPITWLGLYKASHVFIAYPSHPDRPFYLVNEAAGHNLRWFAEPYFGGKIVRLYRFDLDDDVYRAIKNYGSLHSGAPYALLENVGILIAKLFGLKKNPFGSGEAEQKCSEFVLRSVLGKLKTIDAADIWAGVLFDFAYKLPADFDLFGVRDAETVLQWLANHGFCAQANQIEEVK